MPTVALDRLVTVTTSPVVIDVDDSVNATTVGAGSAAAVAAGEACPVGAGDRSSGFRAGGTGTPSDDALGAGAPGVRSIGRAVASVVGVVSGIIGVVAGVIGAGDSAGSS